MHFLNKVIGGSDEAHLTQINAPTREEANQQIK